MALSCCALQSDFVCTGDEPSAFLTSIKAPVGAVETRGVRGNAADDVRKIQDLLNKAGAQEGGSTAQGSSGFLQVDGICGPLTRKAIVAFQRKQFPNKAPDGIVDTDQRTLYRLNQLALPGLDQELIDKATAGLATIRSYLALAITKASAVLSSWRLDDPLFHFPSDEAILNENLHLDRSDDQVRDLSGIISTLQDMLTVVGYVPKGPYQQPAFGFIAASPTQSSGPIPFAFAYGGGWKYLQGFSGRDPVFSQLMRADFIYVTQNLLRAHQGIFVYAIIHELAHYVGGQRGDIDFIDDRAAFHKNPEKYKRLSPYEAATNADSIAQYVWQSNMHAHFRP